MHWLLQRCSSYFNEQFSENNLTAIKRMNRNDLKSMNKCIMINWAFYLQILKELTQNEARNALICLFSLEMPTKWKFLIFIRLVHFNPIDYIIQITDRAHWRRRLQVSPFPPGCSASFVVRVAQRKMYSTAFPCRFLDLYTLKRLIKTKKMKRTRRHSSIGFHSRFIGDFYLFIFHLKLALIHSRLV